MASKKTGAKSASQEKRVPLNVAWKEVLERNERAVKADRLDDQGLVREMQKLFPEKAGKTTITRVTMIRAIYNKGTGMFRSFGPAKRPARRYDAAGDVIEGRVVRARSVRDILPKKPPGQRPMKPKVKVKVKPKEDAA